MTIVVQKIVGFHLSKIPSFLKKRDHLLGKKEVHQGIREIVLDIADIPKIETVTRLEEREDHIGQEEIHKKTEVMIEGIIESLVEMQEALHVIKEIHKKEMKIVLDEVINLEVHRGTLTEGVADQEVHKEILIEEVVNQGVHKETLTEEMIDQEVLRRVLFVEMKMIGVRKEDLLVIKKKFLVLYQIRLSAKIDLREVKEILQEGRTHHLALVKKKIKRLRNQLLIVN